MSALIAEAGVSHQNVVTAFLGASAGFGGLTLVFLGLVVSSLQGFAPGTSAEVTGPYRRPAVTVLAAFAVSLLSCALAATWLLMGGNSVIYGITAIVFFIQLAMVAAAAVHVLTRVLWVR